jgi:hypothetical protein
MNLEVLQLLLRCPFVKCSDNETNTAKSFYGSAMPVPAGSKYPNPETLRWQRPLYDDPQPAGAEDGKEEGEEEEEEFDDEFGPSSSGGGSEAEVCICMPCLHVPITFLLGIIIHVHEQIWCNHGQLFIDGSSSGDVIQVGLQWFNNL